MSQTGFTAPPEAPDTDTLDDRQIIARTAWGEARSLGAIGMQATINTGENRFLSGLRWWGVSLRSIFLHPMQYSCWNHGDPNRAKLLAVTEEDIQFRIALQLAGQVMTHSLGDIVKGADSYYDRRMKTPPKWAEGLVPRIKIGNHLFFKTI